MRPLPVLFLVPLLAGCLQAAPAVPGCEAVPGDFTSGRVLLDGHPVDGALVWWHEANLTHGLGGLDADAAARDAGVVTDAAGRFALPGSGWEIRVWSPGALSATAPVAPAAPGAQECVVVELVGDDFRVVGHRGTSFHAPENTEAALRNGAAQGASLLEMDVRRTSDDVLVLWHDQGLQRLAGLPLDVADAPWSALQAVQVEGPDGPQPVLTLEEALVVADELGVEAVLDLKGSPRNVTRTLELLAPLLESRDAWDRTWLAVRYDSNVEECMAIPGARCVVHRVGGSDPMRIPIEAGASVVSLRHSSVDAETVAKAHDHGIEVWAWTVNDEDGWADMLDADVDGIVTDRPQELSEFVRRYELSASP